MSRALVSAQEWILAVPPPGGTASEITPVTAGILSGEARSRPVQPMAIVRVRSEGGTDEFGAVLHYWHGSAVLYLPASRIESLGAAALSAVANDAGAFATPRPVDPIRAVTVERVSHDSPVHPAAAAVGSGRCVFMVCSRLIDADLAETIGQLWTVHAELIALHAPSETLA